MRRILTVLGLILSHVFLGYAQDVTPSPDYFAEASVDNPTPYVGQQITYTFRFYDAVDVSQPNYAPPDFEGFWQIADRQAQGSVHQINNRQYVISELKTALYPTRPGTLTIEPARVLLPATVYRTEEQIVTDVVTIQVMPLPDGAPPEFNGAVGAFVLSATLDRQSIQLGDPVTLRLTVSGTGNVEQLTLPDPSVPSTWRLYQNPTMYRSSRVDGQNIGEKVYEYQIFPDVIGSQTLPPMTLSYFDPLNGIYQSAATAAVTIEVLPPQIALLPTMVSPPDTVLALKPVPSALYDQTVYPGLMIWLLWLLPPFGLAACIGYVAWAGKQKQRRSQIQQSQALQAACERLQAAMREPESKGYTLLEAAVIIYLCDKLGILQIDKNVSDWRLLLERVPVSSNLKEQLAKCIEWGDEGRYAPEMGLSIEELGKRTEKVLRAVEEGWKSS